MYIVHSMKSAAITLDNYNDANEDALLNEVSTVHSGNSNGKYGIPNNINNHNETALWSKAHDIQASSFNANANPVLRNINNDMTKGISRKSHQCKSKCAYHILISTYIYVFNII